MDLLPHSFSHTIEEGGATTQDNVLEKVLADVHVALLYGVVTVLVDTLNLFVFLTGLGWVEHDFSCAEPLVANKDLSSIWQLVVLLAGVGVLSFLECVLVVIDHIAHLFLDVPHYLLLGLGGERVASLVQDLLEIVGDVSTGKVDSLDCVGDGVALVDWHCV